MDYPNLTFVWVDLKINTKIEVTKKSSNQAMKQGQLVREIHRINKARMNH